MSKYKIKYLKITKKINTTLCLDKGINQIEKNRTEFNHEYI
ncbi:hypothetical protein EU92_2017 [Prochlorococcus marinus str. MIT 9107]|uniref:Uncharacterized protein n=1 Tax=Prochlorococcus marinus str. MIT 9116 TaxID=167544 RepID=A0A0A1ZV38_PROMR|nr:hypothetical protein EU92_2017 [Prochlorococcus marinus str. MIT 9107]KGF93457.1 hypothetical protein EU93_0086 [Prochlorococcus marinus str. MIT 9116]KGF94130.1 hypothetical protein EU94_1036 [Prochlorococcus marinus str. MIT 9123]